MLNIQKTSGRKTVRRLDPARYGKLLTEHQPVRITTAAQHRRTLKAIDRLMDRDHRTAEESALLDLLVQLVQGYERRVCVPFSATPLEVLKELMAAQDLRPSNLWPVFKSKGITSEVLSGKRKISVAHAKALAERFHVSVEVFL